jgi:hypothetical protein
MNQKTQRHEMAIRPVVLRLPDMDTVPVRRDVVYRRSADGPLTLDVYSPHSTSDRVRLPAVVIVIGYSDVGAVPRFGCRFKEMESFINWAQLIAATGLVAITYTNVEPTADAHAVLAYVREHASELGIDAERIGVWACSGNVPVALSTLEIAAPTPVSCAALCYGLMLDPPGTTFVSNAAKMFGFDDAMAGKHVDVLSRAPLFIARAGQDAFAHLNDTIDAFVAAALARNMPVTLVNHATGPHSFDVVDDSDTSRAIIRQILDFFAFHLSR